MPLTPLVARHLLGASLALFATSVALAAPQITEAQKAASKAHAERVLAERGLTFATQEEIDELRTELWMVLTEFHDIEQVVGVRDREGRVLQAPGDPGPSLSTVPGLMDLVGDLSDAELTLIRELLPSLKELHRVSRELRTAVVADRERLRMGRGPTGAGGTAEAGGLPSAIYGCAGGRPSYGATVAALATVQTARGVQHGASRGCDLTAFGFNAALVCLISDGVWIVAEGVWAGIDLCTADADSAEILAGYQRDAVLADRSNQILGATGTIQSSLTSLSSTSFFTQALISGVMSAVEASRGDVLTAVDENEAALLGAVGAGVATVTTRVADAETAIVAAMQSQSAAAVLARLDEVEASLKEALESKRVRLTTLTLIPRQSYLVVATQAGIGPVDVAFDPVQSFGGSGFTNAPDTSFTHMETGVYLLLLTTVNGDVYRLRCRREAGLPGPDGDVLGSVYFHVDAPTSGGQQ